MNLPKSIIVLDTEYVGQSNRFIYDLGYVVATLNEEKREYEVIHEKQAIIKQVYDNRELFGTSHYSNKRPKYISLLKGHKAKRHYVGHAFNTLTDTIDKYGVECILAYSSEADETAFAHTSKFYGVNNPLDNVAVYDLHGICKVIFESEDYKEFAKENNLFSASGYAKTSVESGCKYIYGDPKFEEEHTALSDCYNELDLLNVAVKSGAEIKDYGKTFVEIDIVQPLHIVVTTKQGETKNYTYHYKKKRNQPSKNTIRLTQ